MISMAVLLLVLVAVAGSTVLTWFMFSALARLRQLESSTTERPRELASGGLEELTAELSAVREQLEALEQRTDFNERLLEGRHEE